MPGDGFVEAAEEEVRELSRVQRARFAGPVFDLNNPDPITDPYLSATGTRGYVEGAALVSRSLKPED